MTKSLVLKDNLTGLLTDTWWYGLTSRISRKSLIELAQLRARQGFSAVQLVVGIPPEVGPENPNAASPVGPAWTLTGDLNNQYLQLAVQRIALLNQLGLRVLVYGAWGHQISWVGREKMIAWWREIVRHLDAYDVVYCLTGESNLWIGHEQDLLPDRSTADLWQPKNHGLRFGRLASLAHRAYRRLRRPQSVSKQFQRIQRRKDWSHVLEALSQMTGRPLIIHPNAGETGCQAVDNPQLLSANTTQTGHSQQSRNDLWQLPIRELGSEPGQIFINLEPWYEGISDNFYTADQLYAYWVTMLAGSASYCYGAHGIWHIGDGHFLSHWGRQTFTQAKQLDTPRLLGLSHQLFLHYQAHLDQTTFKTTDDQLLFITRSGSGRRITFYPDISLETGLHCGRFWLPLLGRFEDNLPTLGPVVIISS